MKTDDPVDPRPARAGECKFLSEGVSSQLVVHPKLSRIGVRVVYGTDPRFRSRKDKAELEQGRKEEGPDFGCGYDVRLACDWQGKPLEVAVFLAAHEVPRLNTKVVRLACEALLIQAEQTYKESLS